MIDAGHRWRDPFGSRTLGECFLTPTRIYVKTILDLCEQNLIHAAAHITGGGLIGNVPRVLPAGLTVKIDRPWVVPAEFGWLKQTGGLSSEDMLGTFNCGIGMVLVVPANQAARIAGPTIGEVVSGTVPEIALPPESWWRSPE
jgi:phosphoribosylformylglycinamidine cyclo-ligase